MATAAAPVGSGAVLPPTHAGDEEGPMPLSAMGLGPHMCVPDFGDLGAKEGQI